MRTYTKLLVAVTVFLVMLVGALLVVERASESSGSGQGADDGIWTVGDTWTVTVTQDVGAISPGGARDEYDVPYRFTVTDAPTRQRPTWIIHVTQKGAEGPFAKGWHLQYRERGGAMELTRLAVGDEPAVGADVAPVQLGPTFPYETTYTRAPRSHHLDGAKLMERSVAPPSGLPPAPAGSSSSGSVGAMPPPA